MRKTIIAAFAVTFFLVVLGGYLGLTYFGAQNHNNSSTTVFSMEQIRDQVMVYIAANYTVTFPQMQRISWIGGREPTGLLGSETYMYYSGNWSISLQNPLVEKSIYKISVNYSSDGCVFDWVGTYQDGLISETSNTINNVPQLGLDQEQIRDLISLYIQAYHNQTEPYMQSLTWIGGKITPMGMIGSELYSYQSSGWNVTMQYPVTPNPIYTIDAQYKPMQYWNTGDVLISWQGKLQNGIITETAYKFNP